MAYLPPHKRHSKDADKPAPAAASLTPVGGSNRGHRNRRDRQSSSSQGGGKIAYASGSISRWWPVGGGGADPIPLSFQLEPFACEIMERKDGGKPLVLARGGGIGEDSEEEVEERPWVSIAERVEPDLVAAVGRVMKDLESESEEIKASLVARVGKILFYGNSGGLEAIRKAAAVEADSRNQVHKSFYTNVPSSYMEDIQDRIVPKLGLDFDSEKEHYHVKVFDKCRPDSTISCKCTVVNKELEMYKIELNQVRHMVVDVSCLYQDLDLRLMLITKKIMKTEDDEETDSINKLITSAIIDTDVKGGLRWPLGKESVADRFSIVGVWHTKYKAFKNQTMKVKLRHADRFDYRTSSGEVSNEVPLKLTGISKHLRDGDLKEASLKETVQEAVKLIWDHFLSCNHPFG